MSIKEIIKNAIYEELDHYFLEHRKYSKDAKTFVVELSHKKMDEETERLYQLLFCNWGEDIFNKAYKEIAKNVLNDLGYKDVKYEDLEGKILFFLKEGDRKRKEILLFLRKSVYAFMTDHQLRNRLDRLTRRGLIERRRYSIYGLTKRRD